MSLIVVSKGFPLPYLGIAIMCMSLSTILFEVPSGIFCDAKGRQMGFEIGMIFVFIGTSLLLFTSFPLLCIGFAINGMGRAFTSGSLDALLIEEGQSTGGKIEDTVFALEVSSSLSLALGALLGGYLLSLGSSGPRLTHIVLEGRLLLVGINIILTPLLIEKEERMENPRNFSSQVSLLFKGLRSQPNIFAYISSVVIQGVLLFSLETFWQPYIKELLASDSQLWILGVVVSSLFLMSILGSAIGKFLLRIISAKKLYILLFIADLFLVALLSRSTRLGVFLLLFLLIYVVLGALSITGGTLLNQRVENSLRSSVLSLSSFSVQAGGLLSSLSSIVILSYVDISGFWLITAIGSIIAILFISRRI